MIINISTLLSVPPWHLCPNSGNGYVPYLGLRSERADIAFSPEYGGVQLQADNGSCSKSLYLTFIICNYN